MTLNRAAAKTLKRFQLRGTILFWRTKGVSDNLECENIPGASLRDRQGNVEEERWETATARTNEHANTWLIAQMSGWMDEEAYISDRGRDSITKVDLNKEIHLY